MTRVHPTPILSPLYPLHQVRSPFRSRLAAFLLFFIHALTETRETPNVRSSPRTLLRSSYRFENLFSTFFWIGVWCRIFTALSLACSTAIFLLSIGRSTITHDLFAPAVGTMNRDCDHQTFYLFHDFCSYSTTSFPSLPLPPSGMVRNLLASA